MFRKSRFDPGPDHRDGSKSERRTPPPRLVPAQREKQARREGEAHRRQGSGRQRRHTVGEGREQRGVFSEWVKGTPNVVRNGTRTWDAGRNVSVILKKFLFLLFLQLFAGDICVGQSSPNYFYWPNKTIHNIFIKKRKEKLRKMYLKLKTYPWMKCNLSTWIINYKISSRLIIKLTKNERVIMM